MNHDQAINAAKDHFGTVLVEQIARVEKLRQETVLSYVYAITSFAAISGGCMRVCMRAYVSACASFCHLR